MRLRRYILRGLAVGAAGLLVSCIDGREEIWIHADGSGRADLAYTVPAVAARFQGGRMGLTRMLQDFSQHNPSLTEFGYDLTETNEQLTIHVTANFASALALKEIAKDDSLTKLPGAVNELAGAVNVTLAGRTVDFSRTIAAGKALPGAFFMPASNFAGRNLTYIIHLPEPMVESNATRNENDGRTLIWEIPLADAIQTPFTLHFKSRLPLPLWLLVVAALALVLVAVFMRRKLRKSKQSLRRISSS